MLESGLGVAFQAIRSNASEMDWEWNGEETVPEVICGWTKTDTVLSVSSYSPWRKKKKKKYRKNEVKLEKMFKTQKGIGKEGRKEICPDLLITISLSLSLFRTFNRE